MKSFIVYTKSDGKREIEQVFSTLNAAKMYIIKHRFAKDLFYLNRDEQFLEDAAQELVFEYNHYE